MTYENISSLSNRLEVIPAYLWLKIAQIDELKGRFIATTSMSPQVLTSLKRSVLITSTGASTRIEGARLSDEDIEKLLRGLSVRTFADRDIEEVKGYYELLDMVFNDWRHIHLTENSIKALHRDLLKYAHKDERHRGEYKKAENRVQMFDPSGKVIGTVFETTPAYLTSKEMEDLVAWLTQSFKENVYHPLLIISNFVAEFLKIHPFLDGNGRLSRVLTNLLLLQQGYTYMPYVSHEKLVEDNKAGYYASLRASQKTFGSGIENIVPWLEFLLEILLKQSQMAVGLLSQEDISKSLSKRQLVVWEYLQTVPEATPQEIATKTGVPRPTINQVVGKLLQMKKIERIGQGRSTRYRKT
ncbi:Fic family protein [Patescibacteria group bacterium]|nr:Fic family protein [Patescibacteria group bacterium]